MSLQLKSVLLSILWLACHGLRNDFRSHSNCGNELVNAAVASNGEKALEGVKNKAFAEICLKPECAEDEACKQHITLVADWQYCQGLVLPGGTKRGCAIGAIAKRHSRGNSKWWCNCRKLSQIGETKAISQFTCHEDCCTDRCLQFKAFSGRNRK
mmetsp:Transcript_98806/g.175970  ORF Transcript_98806/g.175970 Transcript_98806/m.175970 type:complete len:155 (+) Transcript_98806:43-507(+)